ncbi:MAG TPA: hypothetical protein VMQ81_01300 [Acidimicrobiia bacterium]|nr:hypothetical protein [Acidimicrobiia bacterium]
MTRRRASRLLAVVCIALGTVVGVLPAPSSAEAPQATGWWSRSLPFQGDVEGQSVGAPVPFRSAGSPSQELPTDPTIPGTGGPVTTVPLPVPVPTIPPPVTLPDDPTPAPNPGVPEGGLWVSNDPTGAVAISALRYRGDIGAGELLLRFAPGSTTAGPVVACPALSEFNPGPAQPWGDRPAHDCARLSLGGRVTPDGTGVQFTIPQGFVPFGERVLDIVILPDPSSGDPFSLFFEAPDESSLDVTQGQELPPPAFALPDLDPFTLPTTLPPAVDTSSGSFDSGGVVVPPAETPSSPPPTELSGPSSSTPTPIAGVLDPFIESRFGRIVAVVVLLAMGGGLWYFGGAPIRSPRLLGALAGDAPVLVDQLSQGRGIGRFRRERAGLPGRL